MNVTLDSDETAQTSETGEVKSSSFAVFETFKVYADKLITDNKKVRTNVDTNRKARRANPDVEQMRAQGKIGPNHTCVGLRFIDTNMANEMPAHIAYLTQSRRLGVFQPEDARLIRDSTFEKEYVEAEFARVMTYPGWQGPYIQMLDASSLHGFNHLEVTYDESKPGHVAVEYCKTELLLFDRCHDIQSSRMVMRRYDITVVDLDAFTARFELDPKIIKKLRDSLLDPAESANTSNPTELQRVNDNLALYRAFYKDENGKVWETWYTPHIEEFLIKEPRSFTNGIRKRNIDMTASDASTTMNVKPEITFTDEQQSEYPFYAKRFRLTEDDLIQQAEGRAEIDYAKQDASSTILSAYLNGCLDATNTMWSPKDQNPGNPGGEPKTITQELKHGAVWDTPMTPFRAPFPEAQMMQAVAQIQTINQTETSQVNFAVNNRKDSRKTATEVTTATQQSTMLSGVQVLMFSLTMTAVLNAAWRIVQSCALEGTITFCPGPDDKNRVDLIEKSYIIKPAGDVDFVQAQERVQKMQQDWPVIQNTALRDRFMKDYIMLRYPEKAEEYTAILAQGNILPQLLTSAMQLLIQAVTDENGSVRPEWQQHIPQLRQLQQQAMTVLQQQAPQAVAQQQPQQQGAQE